MKLLKIVGAMLVLLTIGLSVSHRKIKQPLPDYGAVPDFEFVNQDGHSFGHPQLKGAPWLADFIFTRCMGPCPLVTTEMSRLQKKGRPYNKLQFVSFSVDPAYDTPPRLAAYSKLYGADTSRWHFLTGDKKIIYDLIRNGFHLAVEEAAPPKNIEADFIHSLHFVLVDQNARIRGYYNSTDAEALKKLDADLKQLL